MARRRAIAYRVLAGVAALTTGALSLSSAGAAAAPIDVLVSATPSTKTPNVGDGGGFSVRAVVQMGGVVVQGGLFSTVTAPGSPTGVSRSNLYAADVGTGAINLGFAPVLDGPVAALLPGPVSLPGTVFVGGSFSHVNGTAVRGVALLNLSDASLVAGFVTPSLNGVVTSMGMSGNRLLLGGTFSKVGGAVHAGVASVNATTGAVDPYLSVQLAGHHNYGVNCTPGNNCTFGPVGATKLAVSPDGTQLMVIGNFTSADGISRDQIARLTLRTAGAAVDPGWQTNLYSPACYAFAYDSNVRDVAYSPDGRYLIVVATGGGGTPSAATGGCDAAARFESMAQGLNLQPTWLEYTGNDTLFSVAVTAAAVYVGGHQRWLNNANGSDFAGGGSVPRPGIAALDPMNGLPFSWNPGRNPRGARVDVLYATPTGASPSGLWVGGDTNYIGNFRYYRGKDSFFPSGGGLALPPSASTTLPAGVYLAGALSSGSAADALTKRFFDGSTVGSTSTVPSAAKWSTARGAFMVDNRLIYGQSDGNLYSVTFDGTTFGAPALLDPYHDPAWNNVQTGSGQTYQGATSPFYAQLPGVTGLTYSSGCLFYTLTGDSSLYYRYFTPESGIVGASQFVANSTVNLSHAAGLFTSGGQLYWADGNTGFLMTSTFSPPSTPGGIATGASLNGLVTVADSTNDWRAHALFLGPR